MSRAAIRAESPEPTWREQIDLRLAIGAASAWLAVAVTLGWRPGSVLDVAVAAAFVGALALVIGRGGVRVAGAVALGAFCIVIELVPLAARLDRTRDSPVRAMAHEHLSVTAEITASSDPQMLAAKGPAGSPRVSLAAKLRSVEAHGRAVSASGAVLLLAPADSWREVLPGQRLRVEATLQPPLSSGLLVAVLSTNTKPRLIGRPPWWQRAAGRVRASLRQASAGLPDQPGGLLPGLIDGDTRALDPVLAARFRTAGLTHLVAVSGTNCSIVVGAVLLVCRRARVGPWLAALLGLLVLIAFVVVARPSPSVLRAAAMAVIALTALATGRLGAAIPALAAAVLILLLWSPQLAVDAGFAMSVLATAALLLIAPRWAHALRGRRVPAGIAEPFAVAAAAHLVTAPVVAAIAGQVSVVAIPANMLAEPAVVPATIVGFAAAVVAPLNLGVGSLLAQLAGWPCRWLVWVGSFCGGLDGASLPWPAGLSGAVTMLAVIGTIWWFARHRQLRPLLAVAAMAAVVVQIPIRTIADGWPPPNWILMACDVGQGDALVLPAAAHSAVVIDAGPDPVLVDDCLHELGVRAVPLLVLTHMHLDHVGGIAGVLRGRQVAAALTGPLDEPASGRHLVDAALASHGIKLNRMPTGGSLDIGRVHLDVLGPREAFHGSRSDPNNSSVVLRATVDGVRILLSGDAEVEAQDALLRARADLSAEVLKVPHHGSAYSSPEFLAAVHARVAVISVGAHNDYGHPSPLLLHRLAQLGVPVRRTDLDGDVAVTAHDSSLRTVSHRSQHQTAAALPALRVMSLAHVRIAPCRPELPERLVPPLAARSRPVTARWCCSSGTRNCSLPARSSRSPPQRARKIQMPT